MSGIMFRGEMLCTENGDMTVAQKLFHQRFYCSVPEIFYQTEASLEMLGMRHYDSKMDRNAALYRDHRLYIPPAGMCMYIDQGAPLQLDTIEDAVTIYNLIVQHLTNWKELMEGLVGERPPLQDLRSMDNFAEMLYPLVRMLAPANQVGSYFRQSIGQFGVDDALGKPLGREAPLPPGTETHLGSKPTNTNQGHKSISDIVTREAFKKQWN